MSRVQPPKATTDWFSEPVVQGEIKNKAVRGAAISAFSHIANQAISTLSLIVLARLLTPADFGLIAMVTAAIGIASVLQDLGLSSASIRAQTLSHAQASNLFWINAGSGLIMSALAASTASGLAVALKEPLAQTAALLMSPTFFIAGLTAQHSALMRRNMKFSSITRITFISAVIAAGVSILGASLDLGFTALIAGTIAGSMSRLVLFWVYCDWRPQRPRRGTNIGPLLKFGSHMLMFSILGFIANNIHSLIIGRMFGAAQAGLFSKALRINELLLNNLKSPIALVAPPALSRLRQHPQRFASFYYKACSASIITLMPLVFVGIVLSTETIQLLLGPQWSSTAPILQILAAGLVPKMLSVSTGWVFHSAGSSANMLRWGAIGWTSNIIATVVGANYGPTGIALALTCTAWALMLPNLAFAFNQTPLKITKLMPQLINITALSFAAGTFGAVVKTTLPEELSLFLRFTFVSVSFIGFYALGLLLSKRHRNLIAEVLSELKLTTNNPAKL